MSIVVERSATKFSLINNRNCNLQLTVAFVQFLSFSKLSRDGRLQEFLFISKNNQNPFTYRKGVPARWISM